MSIANMLQTNVNEHVEKKAGLTYLSWAWAWAEALKADPEATWEVMMFDTTTQSGFQERKCYMDINGTGMVFVTVTLFGKKIACQLPVMDSANNAIPFAGRTMTNKYGKEYRIEFDAFAVNTAIMRCMTKALSLHGLGLYIYAGEDLPEEGEVAKKGDAPVIPSRPKSEDLNLSSEELVSIKDMALYVIDVVKTNPKEALAFINAQGLESEQKIALFNELDSKTRSALKAAKE